MSNGQNNQRWPRANKHAYVHPPHTSSPSLKDTKMMTGNETVNKKQTNKRKEKKNLPHHNSQTLLHGYSDLIHFTAAQMHHKSLLGDIWSPQLC